MPSSGINPVWLQAHDDLSESERKQTEEALRRSEEQNRSLLQINNAIITNLTQEALLRSISDALHRVIRAGMSAPLAWHA